MRMTEPHTIDNFHGKFADDGFVNYHERSPLESECPEDIWSSNKNGSLAWILRSLPKLYYPSKVFYSATTPEGSSFLATELAQSGRDNAGRAFNLVQTKLVPNDSVSVFQSITSCTPPLDKEDPKELGASKPFEAIYDEKTKKIFAAMADSIRSQKPVCVIDDEIDCDTIRSTKEVDSWTFQDFPGGAHFLSALKLFPPELQKKIPFALNYEDGLLGNENGLGIKAIYCGRKTILNEKTHSGIKSEIHFDSVARAGFNVVELAKYTASSADSGLYDSLAGKDSPPNSDARFGELTNAIDAAEKEKQERAAALKQQQEAALQKEQKKKDTGGFFSKFFRDPDAGMQR
jgi:hypothetical protein